MSFEYITPAITKWKLDDFMDVVDEFENEFAERVRHKVYVSRDYPTILLHIAGKAFLTTREILTLCAHGYSDGALSLGRNLYEQMMIASIFEIHKNDVDFQTMIDDYFLSYEVQRNKMLRAMEHFLPDGGEDDLNLEWEKIKKRTKKKITGDYWWAGCDSFRTLVERVIREQDDLLLRKFLGIHYARYKRACLSLHASCMGNAIRIGGKVNMALVDTSPSVYGQSTPLVYAAVSLISVFGFICSAFNIDHTNYLKKLNELAIFYQNMEMEDERKNA